VFLMLIWCKGLFVVSCCVIGGEGVESWEAGPGSHQ